MTVTLTAEERYKAQHVPKNLTDYLHFIMHKKPWVYALVKREFIYSEKSKLRKKTTTTS